MRGGNESATDVDPLNIKKDEPASLNHPKGLLQIVRKFE